MDVVSARVQAWSAALSSISSEKTRKQRLAKLFLEPDPLEQMVSGKLLEEALEQFFIGAPVPPAPLILFMDRTGGGGIRATSRVMRLLAEHWQRSRLIHVAFRTPARGVGILLRHTLQGEGAKNGMSVQTLAHDRPAEGLKASPEEIRELVGDCDLVLTFAPGGSQGLVSPVQARSSDPLLERSHLAVLSFPDPDFLVAELPRLSHVAEREPGLDAIRFWVQVARGEGEFEDLGAAILGPDGDARDRLWALIDNARRQPYRVLLEPSAHGLPAGEPLICPCRTVIEKTLACSSTITRIVPAGTHLIAVAQGNSSTP